MKTRLVFLAVFVLGLFASAVSQVYYFAGNGHYYELVATPRTWDLARDEATTRTYFGVTGHLLTISNQAENDFIVATWGETAREKYIGGHTTASVWGWVTGEPFVYTNWAPGEPNGSDAINFFGAGTLGSWNDVPSFLQLGYFVEYDVPLTRTLTVQSQNPNSGVPITVYTADTGGLKNGTTTFTRTYNTGSTVSIGAPATAAGFFFHYWEVDGVPATAFRTLAVNLQLDHTVKAVYRDAFIVSINSVNPTSGVPISVWTADELGRTHATTAFDRLYTQGTSASFTAPRVVGNNYFLRWDLDGSPWQAMATVTLSVSMARTLTAVYATGIVLTVEASEPSVPIQVWGRDKVGQGNGATTFTRLWAPGTSISMTAPATQNGKPFLRWEKDGVAVSGTAKTVTVTMDVAHTLRAVYAP